MDYGNSSSSGNRSREQKPKGEVREIGSGEEDADSERSSSDNEQEEILSEVKKNSPLSDFEGENLGDSENQRKVTSPYNTDFRDLFHILFTSVFPFYYRQFLRVSKNLILWFISIERKLITKESVLCQIRYVVVGLMTCYIIFTTPFSAVFLENDHSTFRFFEIVNGIVDVVFVNEIVLRALTPYECKKTLKKVTKVTKTCLHYTFSIWSVIDVIQILPLTFLLRVAPSMGTAFNLFCPYGLFRLNRLLIILRFNSIFDTIEQLTIRLRLNPLYIRILNLAVICALVAHWVSCIFYVIVLAEGREVSIAWTQSNDLLTSSSTASYAYFFSLYWSLLTLIGLGGTMPVSDVEVIFSTLVVFIGLLVFATIIGAVGSLFLNVNAAESTFKEKMGKMKEKMRAMSLEPELARMIFQYYNYVWHIKKGMNEEAILGDLPVFLRREVSWHLNKGIISKVPLFKNASQGFVQELVVRLNNRIALPESNIIRQGERGSEMFFLSTGRVNVVVGNGRKSKVVHTFHPGDFFGEIALLKNVKRTANCIAKDFCDLYVLEKKEFDVIMDNFPEDAARIIAAAERRATKKK